MKTATDENRSSESEYVVLYGVSWETYEGILDALGEYHLRHTYDEGTLEMRRLLYGVTWEDYLKLLDATPEFSLPHTFDEGTLEMMSPRKDHDWVAKLIARMIEAFALAVDLPIQSIGSTTLRAAKGGRGLQPDETYYLANEPRVRCKDTYEPGKDPPPDLAIEVDVTSSSVPRMPVFAKIGVPEIWRIERGRVRFYRLKSKTKYETIERSVAFPFLKPADLMRFVKRRAEIGENGAVRGFVEWAKKARLRKSK
ncbi:MAG TPA: Uma2 family endonuclease [Thermoguttaceae bacterium]|nr:Uma2 family endonuclease [Thermoguttaceae bacterium]